MSDEELIDALIVGTEDDKVRWRRHIFYTGDWVTSGLPRWRLEKGPFGWWRLHLKSHDGPTGVRRIRLWGRAPELLAAVDAQVARGKELDDRMWELHREITRAAGKGDRDAVEALVAELQALGG